MKILVTGATGFIGRHLVRRLVKEERSVKCLVREKSSIKSLEKLGVELVYGDLLNKDSLKRVVGDEEVSVVYHLASAVYARNNKEFYEVNVSGTRNLLRSCSQNGLKKFIYLSSLAVCGLSKKESLINETSPCNPFTPYGRSKLIAENLILDFYNGSNTSVIIIRAPVVYGPDGQADLLTDNFQKILGGRAYIISDGTNLRSLCYIDNLIEGLVLAERRVKSKSNIYVIADGKVYTFIEIVNTIADIYNIKLHKFCLPSLVASISRHILNLCTLLGFFSWKLYSLATMNVDLGCDITCAKEELGYYPGITLQEGIKRTIQWYKEEGRLRN